MDIKKIIPIIVLFIFCEINESTLNAQQERITIHSDQLKLYDQDRYKNNSDKLYKEKDLFWLLNLQETDSKLKLERLTAYYFHQIINSYRLKLKLNTLYWEDQLWLSARNHNAYMAQQSKLTHRQRRGNPLFSGVMPQDRLNYILFKNEGSPLAENCVYFYYEMIDFDKVTEDEISKAAYYIANKAFNKWRYSMGHYENMKNKRYSFHGTSFLLSNGKVFATTNFADEVETSLNEEIGFTLKDPELNKVDEPFIIYGKHIYKSVLDLSEREENLFTVLTKVMGRSRKKKSIELNQAASKYQKDLVNDMAMNTSLKKRYIEETGFFGRFNLIGKSIQHMSFKIIFDKTETIRNTAEIKLEYILENHIKKIEQREKTGGSITLKEEGDKVVCLVDVFLIAKKNKGLLSLFN